MELNLLVNRIDLFFLISLLGFTYYGIYGLVSFNLYMVLFNKARTNILFQNSICPNNFVKGANKCYELVAYGMSSLNALIISIFSIIYITGMYYSYSAIDFENSYQIIYKFSMGYYIADIFYILIVALTTNPLLVSVNTYEDEKLGKKLNESRRLSQQDIFFIIHHLIVIYYQYFTLYNTNDLELLMSARSYISFCNLSELAVIPLNYGWYLINTKQTQTRLFKITAIITLIIYFFSRVVNLTILIYLAWLDGLIYYSLIGFPLVFLNYYWFYKLLSKTF